jgi:hypothetical protein
LANGVLSFIKSEIITHHATTHSLLISSLPHEGVDMSLEGKKINLRFLESDLGTSPNSFLINQNLEIVSIKQFGSKKGLSFGRSEFRLWGFAAWIHVRLEWNGFMEL